MRDRAGEEMKQRLESIQNQREFLLLSPRVLYSEESLEEIRRDSLRNCYCYNPAFRQNTLDQEE